MRSRAAVLATRPSTMPSASTTCRCRTISPLDGNWVFIQTDVLRSSLTRVKVNELLGWSSTAGEGRVGWFGDHAEHVPPARIALGTAPDSRSGSVRTLTRIGIEQAKPPCFTTEL